MTVTDPWAIKWLKTGDGKSWLEAHDLPTNPFFAPERECTSDDPHPVLKIALKEGDTINVPLFEIKGTADATGLFESWVLEYAPGSNPRDWKTLNGGDSPVKNSTLAMWNLADIPNGAVTLRLTNVYGPRMALNIPCQGFLSNFLRRLLLGQTIEIYGDGNQLRDPMFVDDAVEAFLKAGAAARPPSRLYNVGGPQALSLSEIARMAVASVDAPEPVFRPFPEYQKQIDIGGGPSQTIADAPDGRGGAWGSGGTIVFSPTSGSPLFMVSDAGGTATPLTVFATPARRRGPRAGGLAHRRHGRLQRRARPGDADDERSVEGLIEYDAVLGVAFQTSPSAGKLEHCDLPRRMVSAREKVRTGRVDSVDGSGPDHSCAALAELSERLFDCGVVPYYLHQLDRAAGTAHFEVGDERARELVAGLRARLPGYLVPRLVRETAGEAAKSPL